MAKQSHRAKKAENLGKGKVTPVQVAFIVDRYLADNNYRNALAAFRSEAADLFSKTKGKEVPKGLLGLGEILDEYIRLKEQKIVLDQEKRLVETAMNGLQEVMRAYQSGTSTPLPSSPPLIPPQFVGASMPPLLPPPQPNNGSPPNSVMNYQAVTTNHAIHNLSISTPQTNPSVTTNNNTNKRKSSNLLPKAPKKPFSQSSTLPSSSKPVPTTTGTSQEKPNNSIAKNLFKSDQPISKSSPETPQFQNPNPNPNSNPNSNSKCSVISSQERILVSPNKAYYSVERSYQITSPYKPSVKGKLDFDRTDLDAGNEIPDSDKAGYSDSTSPELGNEIPDFDFPDFDILNGDFSFSELLIDLDLGCESTTNNNQTENIASLDQELNGEATKLSVEDYSNDDIIQGPESVTSIRAITKRIKIMSPVKTRRNS
ncbi:hypothetical protein LUZ60_015247 [Juncus effusus]|nr:hypothetical protein LUZ60_015247 [Juncus effusus]